MYEQGVNPELSRTVLTSDLLGLYAVGGASYGTHESQSRLWENRIGRRKGSGSCIFRSFKKPSPKRSRMWIPLRFTAPSTPCAPA